MSGYYTMAGILIRDILVYHNHYILRFLFIIPACEPMIFKKSSLTSFACNDIGEI